MAGRRYHTHGRYASHPKSQRHGASGRRRTRRHSVRRTTRRRRDSLGRFV